MGDAAGRQHRSRTHGTRSVSIKDGDAFGQTRATDRKLNGAWLVKHALRADLLDAVDGSPPVLVERARRRKDRQCAVGCGWRREDWRWNEIGGRCLRRTPRATGRGNRIRRGYESRCNGSGWTYWYVTGMSS